MAYSFLAISDLSPYTSTDEARRTVLRSKGGPILVNYSKDDLIQLTSPMSSRAPVGNLLGMPLADDKEGLNVEEVEKSGASSKSPPATGIRSLADDKEGLTVKEVEKSQTSSESPGNTETRSLADDQEGLTVTEVGK